MARQPDGPPPPPTVQKLRIRYAKRGRLRFASHRDLARTLERALRRAGVPMAFSAGFSPHPKISWVGAAPTGVASEAEYVEIGLAERVDASHWQAELPGVGPEEASAAVQRFLALETAPVERLMKDGRRTIDARAAVVGMDSRGKTDTSDPCAIIDMVVRHTTPATRPDDVLTALRQAAALSTPVTPVVTRLAQGLLGETPLAPGALPTLADPLATDVDANTGLPPA